MKERIAQLKARYQNYSAREKIILKIYVPLPLWGQRCITQE